ncbi:hypothetical protein G3580_14890 [Nitrogeniibacter mangrovi]|uniref:General secretion pathway protein GspM n=1 Tax=Nitrogeniibacter mangrovi TaxID=2016596 RepID=A0A6C1B5S9_9RHOO|nr:hypothetical protein [Nitrogeniibacter mangrovi]QID18793.1 hypothetical protein G3580_14890 [Nitrogeniibacter mangrovi]
MTPWQTLRLLRWQLSLALVLVALGATAVFYANARSRDAAAHLEQARADHLRASTALQRARQQEGDVRHAIGMYAELRRAGLIGTEQRLSWVEALDRARRRYGIGEISYEILPQQPLDATAGQSDLTWMESRMRLSMSVRHGQVLIDMLSDLASVHNAIVQPRHCELDRASGELTGLRVRCELRWLTLRQGSRS